MATYKIEVIEQDICKDSYEEGEIDHIATLGGYTELLTDSLAEVKDRLDELGAEADLDDSYWCWSILEDENRQEAIPAQIAEWKEGRLELYITHYVAIVTKTVQINNDIRNLQNVRIS